MSLKITADHFLRAAGDIGRSGDNDTLPYDVDAHFVKQEAANLAAICFELYEWVESQTKKDAVAFLNGISVSAERLLAPAGSHGFRIVTRIHPFWNLYLNGLAVGIGEAAEPRRNPRVHSYRMSATPDAIFEPSRSWRAYKEATLSDPAANNASAVIVQTDISSFYERIYHHRLENLIEHGAGASSHIATQVDRLLSKLAAGRSFGLPVGGQGARILAEIMLMPIDEALTDSAITWHRYVDDYTLICGSQQGAYRALSILSHSLADFGLSLNRTKTTIMNVRHYRDYVRAQLGDDSDEAGAALRELDLHFDPYSDSARTEYEALKSSVENINFEFLLGLEQAKSQPDAFVLAQIARALRFQDPKTALQICATLLNARNIDAFRASFSKIMRGVYAVRSSEGDFAPIIPGLDVLIDNLPESVPHLLLPEANVLHYLRLLRFKKTDKRGRFVRRLYETARSRAVRRACIDCWRLWQDRSSFLMLRNQWQNLAADEQRMVWLAADAFGEEGYYAKRQLRLSIAQSWSLGIEEQSTLTFSELYSRWAENVN